MVAVHLVDTVLPVDTVHPIVTAHPMGGRDLPWDEEADVIARRSRHGASGRGGEGTGAAARSSGSEERRQVGIVERCAGQEVKGGRCMGPHRVLERIEVSSSVTDAIGTSHVQWDARAKKCVDPTSRSGTLPIGRARRGQSRARCCTLSAPCYAQHRN